jgi:hypothetical protein
MWRMGNKPALGTIGFEVKSGPDAQRAILKFPRRSTSGAPLDPVAPLVAGQSRLFGTRQPDAAAAEPVTVDRPNGSWPRRAALLL